MPNINKKSKKRESLFSGFEKFNISINDISKKPSKISKKVSKVLSKTNKDLQDLKQTSIKEEEIPKIDIYEFRKEFDSITLDLEKHHGIFAQLTYTGIPVLDSSIPTAAVFFDKEGECIQFSFNPKFWIESSYYKKVFVVAHECLHVMLSHGSRLRGLPFPDIANIAVDIIVNEMLTKKFRFDKDKIEDSDDLIWFDKVFKDQPNILSNQSSEYYYNRIIEEIEYVEIYTQKFSKDKSDKDKFSKSMNKWGELVDSHEGLESFDEKAEKIIAKHIENRLSSDEIEDFCDSIKKESDEILKEEKQDQKDKSNQAGSMAGNLKKIITARRVKTKRKWETVIKKWSMKFNEDLRRKEHWLAVNRRTILINSNIFLPTAREEEDKIESMINVWFFLDTSGSCAGYAERFWQAAESLDPKRFKIRPYCFDTKVYPIDIKKKELRGFGGTFFHIIEEEIQRTIKKEELTYPEAVFLITDGYGNAIKPQIPNRWYWFLTEYNSRNCIPENSQVFELKEYE